MEQPRVRGAVPAARFGRVVTIGWFEYYLRGDLRYEARVYGDAIQAEVTAGLLTLDAKPRQPRLSSGQHDRAE